MNLSDVVPLVLVVAVKMVMVMVSKFGDFSYGAFHSLKIIYGY